MQIDYLNMIWSDFKTDAHKVEEGSTTQCPVILHKILLSYISVFVID